MTISARENCGRLYKSERVVVIDRCNDQLAPGFACSHSRTFLVSKRESRSWRCRMQEQHIIGIDHGGVGRFAMRLPDRPAVKILERLRAKRHVPKTSQPDKSVWIIHVPELTDDLHPERFLRFDKFPVEQIDQHIPLSRMQRVLPQLHKRAASLPWLRVRIFHAGSLRRERNCRYQEFQRAQSNKRQLRSRQIVVHSSKLSP
jgi:hypothetical protein